MVPTGDSVDQVSCRHDFAFVEIEGQSGSFCHHCGLEEPVHGPAPQAWERPNAANVAAVDDATRDTAADILTHVDSGGMSVLTHTMRPVAETAIDAFLSGASSPGGIDAFLSGEPGADAPAKEAKTERLGYICKDPVLGDFRRYKNGKKKGITRATTFNKAATNSKAITDWNKRNIVIGAARRPDIVAKANAMDVNQNVRELMDLVDQLEEAAGGNVASNMGTEVHKWTERVDAGDCKIDDVPPVYRPHVQLYVDALHAKGFHVVKSLRERTTYIKEFGGVAGTFDAILYHEPSGTYRISDTKSGKSMDNGWDEIQCQEWIYQTGYNEFGTYNWDTEEWEAPEHRVSEDYGLVIHLPFAGPHAGTCRLLLADLREGAEHAELCRSVREGGKGKAVPWSLPELTWDERFSAVRISSQAGALWQEARAAGVSGLELNRLVALAQRALSLVDTSDSGV